MRTENGTIAYGEDENVLFDCLFIRGVGKKIGTEIMNCRYCGKCGKFSCLVVSAKICVDFFGANSQQQQISWQVSDEYRFSSSPLFSLIQVCRFVRIWCVLWYAIAPLLHIQFCTIQYNSNAKSLLLYFSFLEILISIAFEYRSTFDKLKWKWTNQKRKTLSKKIKFLAVRRQNRNGKNAVWPQ